ncbi:transmembrane protein 126A-like isoform X2 [Haliotis rufescens]|uniref:transmembrane protein 126A-like isoform X2 n=1 Tax=Haliotis rufescens TaxID=6454 RepID=UPI001EAFF583|nr:transmembrane protein 126A-like isoform X2 [Haliotis rufescens]
MTFLSDITDIMEPLPLTEEGKPKDRSIYRLKHIEDVPEGAVRMTTEEVLMHHMKVIRNWDKPLEVWPLRHGTALASATAAVGGWIINAHYRQKFRLQNYGRMASYLPAVCLPAMMTAFFHQFYVQNNILVGKYDCTVCMETRSGAVNSLLGGLYPLLLSPVSCIILARKYYTVPVPRITEPTLILNLMRKTSPMVGGLFLLVAGQFTFGMLLAEREITKFQNVLVKTSGSLRNDEDGYD